jgi:hypothetical protein
MKFSTILRPALFVFAVLGGFFSSGCTAPKVQPWERATLTTYPMRPDRDPQAAAMAEHIWFSREAASGGRGVGGSGCGCN